MTRHALVVAVGLALAIGGTAQAAWVTDLVSYWDFDDTLADDATYGSGNDGSMSGGTAAYLGGMFGNAIDLPGGTVDDHVIIPEDDNDFDFAGKANGLTISAWIKVDNFDTAWQALVAKGELNKYRIARYNDTNNMGYAGAGNGSDIQVSLNVNDGQWHHVVAITETGGAASRLYVDGSGNVASTTGAGIGDNDLNLRIGNNPEQLGRGWDGLIDDVAIWGRPLSAAEVDTIYNGGAGQSIGDLVPEPATMALLALGVPVLVRRRRA